MKLKELLEEQVGAHVLYHNVSIKSAHTEATLMTIATGGTFKAHTKNRLNNVTNKRVMGGGKTEEPQKVGTVELGTSFTRDKQMALSRRNFGDIAYEVDRDKLRQNNKIVPLDDRIYVGRGRRQEVEEFVIGDIKNFANAIIKVHVNLDNTKQVQGKLPDLVVDIEKALMVLHKNYPHIKIVKSGTPSNEYE